MSSSGEVFAIELLSGRRRGLAAATLRGALRGAEVPYAMLMSIRNALYDSGTLRSHRVAIPVISVGNITAGGTGKTPIVIWLASKLRDAGSHPAILLRGYRSSAAAPSDEATLLDQQLNPSTAATNGNFHIPVVPNPDRVASANFVAREHPGVNLLILDDGFQHRRLARQFDLVLIDATNPFGFGHVHPRGLLREPLIGLRRAHAFVLTRTDLVPPSRITEIDEVLRTHNPTAPVYRTHHALTSLRTADDAQLPLNDLANRRFFASAAVGNPTAFDQQLRALPGEYRGHFWFSDHHAYTSDDLSRMRDLAAQAGAESVLITEKDWTKLRHLPGAPQFPFLRVQLAIRFEGQGESGLLQFLQAQLEKSPSG